MLKKKYWLFFSLFILGVFLFTSCLPKPPATEGILKGQVMVPEGSVQAKELTGQALPDATVNIIDLSIGEIIATTITDTDGYYQVLVPAGGPYLLEGIKEGIRVQQITPQVEADIEYNLGTVDCSTTSVALIAQAMLEDDSYPNGLADINLVDIETDPDFDEVMNIVCSIIEAGEDPAESAFVQQALEDFLNPPTPSPNPTTTPASLESIAITTPAAKLSYSIDDALAITGLVVTGTYSDTTTKVETITTGNVTGFDSSAPVVDQVLTITVGDKTTTYLVTIVATPITSIEAISGTAQVGVELTAGALAPAAATATYQWRISSDGTTYADISGATGTTYTPVADDVAKFIKVLAAGTGNYSGSVTSDPTAAVAAAEIAVAGVTGFVAPVTGGIAQVFGDLTAGAATYTVTGLTWAPADSTFTAATVYTATIVLTSAPGNKFPAAGIAVLTADGSGTVSAGTTSGGDVSGNTLSFTVLFPATAAAPLAIGDSYGGGKVAYILQPGETIHDASDNLLYSYDANIQHGLIAAAADQSTGKRWYNGTNLVTGATAIALGTGSSNTTKIITEQGEIATSYAAGLARAYSSGIYNDWYLPSKDELNKLYLNKVTIGGFAGSYYWSSSELSSSSVYYQSFGDGSQSSSSKNSVFHVRAVRSF